MTANDAGGRTASALLAARFGLLPDGTDPIELDKLLSLFYQLPRVPKLVGPQVLRQSLAEGVRQGLFGLACGSAWDADDAVLRFGEFVDSSEIQFPLAVPSQPRHPVADLQLPAAVAVVPAAGASGMGTPS